MSRNLSFISKMRTPFFSDKSNQQARKHRRRPHLLTWFSALVLLFVVTIVLIGYQDLDILNTTIISHTKAECPTPSLRQEWRSLDKTEKHSYLQAVQCLRELPSRLGRKQRLYEDFPWVHSTVGADVHDSAAFMPWHRYFIHLYEDALKNTCGYGGFLPYWDWSLDFEDLAASPIWRDNDGFGGDGQGTCDIKAFLDGCCVTDGPFANLPVPVGGSHCLTRGFVTGEERTNLSRQVHSSAIEHILSAKTYEIFNARLEEGLHAVIPGFVRGDFALFTAPFDPVFFLHHTQLDRLWWLWQQQSIPGREQEYTGVAARHSTINASLDDFINVGGLGKDVRTMRVMSTQNRFLCYRY